MTDLYVTDKKGRNVYYVYNLMTPSGGVIRTIKYDFGIKGYGIAFVARDCLDTLGYKYKDKEPNQPIYTYVSKENIINGRDTKTKEVYIQVDRIHVRPVVLVTLNGFFELITKSSMPDAIKFQYWVNNEVLPALSRGENMAINIHNDGGFLDCIESNNEKAGIPNIRGTQGDQLKEMISNYAKLRSVLYPVAARDFKKAFWNAYHIDINKLKGSGTEYQKIVSNGLFEQAKAVLNILIGQCSNANIESVSKNTDKALSQLTNEINDLSYYNSIYKNLVNSDPNYIVINDTPYRCERVVKRLTNEQIDAINEYANKYGVDPVEAMHVLFD